MIQDFLSPNHSMRSTPMSGVDMIVVHYTGMPSKDHALENLCNLGAQVSSHYLIDEHGELYNLVPEADCAWHAGRSSWRDRSDLNHHSIGIELVNPGHDYGYTPYPPAQMYRLIEVLETIYQKHEIPAYNIVGHSDIAPSRKKDPGELFDWKWLAEKGFGLWPEVETMKHDHHPTNLNIVDLQSRLAKVGYPIGKSGVFDQTMQDVIIAFKRHFCPEFVDHHWQQLADRRLNRLLELIDSHI